MAWRRNGSKPPSYKAELPGAGETAASAVAPSRPAAGEQPEEEREEFCRQVLEIGLAQARRAGLAGEAAQDCALGFVAHILLHQEGLPPGSPPVTEAWLHRCAFNWAHNELRHTRRLRFHEALWADPTAAATPGAVSDSPETLLIRAELHARIAAVVARLLPGQRTLFVRHYHQGQAAAEIAAALGRTPNAVRQALWALRHRLRVLFEEAGLDEEESAQYLCAAPTPLQSSAPFPGDWSDILVRLSSPPPVTPSVPSPSPLLSTTQGEPSMSSVPALRIPSSAERQRWQLLYDQVPLRDVPRHYAGLPQSPFLMEYLRQVLLRCPEGGRTLETGVGSGYGAVWLSLRGVRAEGIDYAPPLVERARQVNDILGGAARFRTGDLFDLYRAEGGGTGTARPYNVIHHQGVLEHFTAPLVRAALAQQVALADWVVFSVPSVYYPHDPEFGDERLLPLGEWEHLLEPFEVEDLRYYGDPQNGGQEHVLCVLRGATAVSDGLLGLMDPGPEPYLPGVSAVVHTRNEARHISEALGSLQGWADELIVWSVDDGTPEIAREMGATVVSHPRIGNFDRARNVSAMRARHRWVFFLDADERVPPALGETLRRLAHQPVDADQFEALLVPFRHHFAGQWMRCLYPGYTAPRLLRNGRFVWGARPHTGAQVDGRTALFPADDPDLALVHYSFDGLSHYLDKLNRYTDSESANLHRDGTPFHWTRAVEHFARDLQSYCDQGALEKDGVHGFLYAFLSGFYRFEQWGKLYERRYRAGQLGPEEREAPASAEQILEVALETVRRLKDPVPEEEALPAPPAIPVARVTAEVAEGVADVVWSGPLDDPSGYGEECRNFLHALDGAGAAVAAHPLPWSRDSVDRPEAEQARYQALLSRPVRPGFVHVVQNFPTGFFRHPEAGAAVGRTMFETDRLPEPWVRACNVMDRIWVPSEFNRETFARSGVAAEKLRVVPGCFDTVSYKEIAAAHAADAIPRLAETGGGGQTEGFAFLSVFDWTLHKGWDVLLLGFLEAFAGRPEVSLVLKAWSTLGYVPEDIRRQAADLVRSATGRELADCPQVRFVTDRLGRGELLRLFAGADAFVLPSRGEGWGRPYLEAMALGLPTIGTGWSGNTAFMTEENSYLVRHTVAPVPPAGWREVPTYRGHRWAEPDRAHLVETLFRVVEERRGEAAERAGRGQEEVTARFSREAVGPVVARAVEEAREGARPHPVPVAPLPTGGHTPTPKGTGAGSPVRVRWEGTQFRWHSLAHVNREICRRLLDGREGKDGQKVELSLTPFEHADFGPEQEPVLAGTLAERVLAPLSGPADVHVRHFFPPRLNRPAEGRLALIQPWEFGYLPDEWVAPIRENVDEVWCYSGYVREVYRASGIPEDKLRVVPLGVDPETFSPGAPPYVFTDEPGAGRLPSDGEPFTFLFVGGTLHRKGIDILLDAFLRAFSTYDDVRLVIKDTGTQTVYRDQNARERCLDLAQDPTRPQILYLEEDLSPHRLAGIYTAADCLVQPYRGEGFCLPALEAMACGVPVVVPAGGPTDDFVDEAVGWRVPAERKPFGDGRIGPFDCVGPTWMLEVSVEDLARQMRRIATDSPEAKRRGAAAADRVRAGWTWDHTAAHVRERLSALAALPPAAPRLTTERQAISPSPQPVPAAEGRRRKTGQEGSAGSSPVDAAPRAPGLRKPPTVSLCMIVKNEERVLGDCLASVRPWFDEVVVVDTGSTDRTVEIAREHGAKVFHFPWCDDFSAARNVSLSHATGDWVVWMDADDTLPEDCGRKLRETVLTAETGTTAFLMQVHIPPAPGELGFTVVDHVKIFRNLPALRFEGRIHEQILEAISRVGGRVERTDLYVVHSGYDHSPEGQKKKRERDLTILEKEVAERPDHPFVWFNIGMTAFHMEDYEKAVPALERCLELAKPRESIVRKVYAMLAGCGMGRRDLAAARDWMEKGLALFPRDPELLFRAGILYRDLGDLAAAERAYVTLLTEREVGHLDSLDVTMVGFKAHHNLALIYRDRGRLAEAEQAWRAALAHQPDFVPSWLGLGELYLAQGRAVDADTVAGHLEGLAPQDAAALRQRIRSS